MSDDIFLVEPEHQHSAQSEGPYPQPQRACLICGQQAWVWGGDNYRCGSGDPAHQEYEEWHVKTFGPRT